MPNSYPYTPRLNLYPLTSDTFGATASVPPVVFENIPQPIAVPLTSSPKASAAGSAFFVVGVILLVLGMLAIAILQIVGMGYVVKCAFTDNFNCQYYTSTQKNLIKLAAVLFFITLGFALLSGIGRIGRQQCKTRSLTEPLLSLSPIQLSTG